MHWISGVTFLIGQSVASGVRSSNAQLCNEVNCSLYEYCSVALDHQCRPCSTICDSKSRNFDENTCDENCQDYIHDKIRHYIKQSELLEFEARLERLNNLVGVSLFIGIILSILAILVVVFVWIRYRKYISGNKMDDDFYKKKMEMIKYISTNNSPSNGNSSSAAANNNLPQITIVNPTTAGNNGASPMRNLNVKIPSESHCGGSSPSPPSTGGTTTTQICGHLPRYPSEDATLEFAAYDNPAMTPTPPRTSATAQRY